MVSRASVELKVQLIDALRLPVSLADFNSHRENTRTQDQKRTDNPKLSTQTGKAAGFL